MQAGDLLSALAELCGHAKAGSISASADCLDRATMRAGDLLSALQNHAATLKRVP
jgi:hypothetical protein